MIQLVRRIVLGLVRMMILPDLEKQVQSETLVSLPAGAIFVLLMEYDPPITLEASEPSTVLGIDEIPLPLGPGTMSKFHGTTTYEITKATTLKLDGSWSINQSGTRFELRPPE